MKAKLKTNYDTSAIETRVFKKVGKKREKCKLSTLEELEKLVTYRSTIRLVVMPNKLWALKNYDGKTVASFLYSIITDIVNYSETLIGLDIIFRCCSHCSALAALSALFRIVLWLG